MEHTLESIQAYLLEEARVPDTLIAGIMERVAAFSGDTRARLHTYLETGAVQPFALHGVTSQWLIEHKDMQPIGLLIAYDWLARDGDQAAELLTAPER